jgi:CheY-like chemotaxis protein
MQEIKHLLLADDDFDDAFFFKEAINGLAKPPDTKLVKDGEQLMKYLKANLDNLPDIVFLDLNMPRKNGLDCLREIKKDQRLQSLRVIIYSTSDQEEVIKLLYKAGAQLYVQKPDNYHKLKTVVKRALDMIQKLGIRQPAQEEFVITA